MIRKCDVSFERQLSPSSSKIVHPFLKWAGGKGQLLHKLSVYAPKSFHSYYEPFLGGGALFFHLASVRPHFRAVLSDSNEDLMTAYQIIRDNIEELILLLVEHKKHYECSPKQYYYSVRDNQPGDRIEKVARLIFLNKTCYNGLYRVNRKGKFNVPHGRNKNPNICDEENLRAVSELLKLLEADLVVAGFKEATMSATENDFVYFDPPYQPVSASANFTSYTNCGFTLEDQRGLFLVFDELNRRKCKVLLSNSDTPWIEKLYSKFLIKRVKALRAINCTSDRRKGHTELIISNYPALE